MDIKQIIMEEAARNGLPSYIPLTIAQHESGLNPRAVGDNGTSFGLFQLHRGGLAPAHLSAEEMFDPRTNAQIALPKMVGAYKAGVSLGLNGYDLVAYTANNSAWPGNIGVDSPEAQRYGVGLRRAYSLIGNDGSVGTVTPPMGEPQTNLKVGSFFSDVSLLDLVLIGAGLIILLAAVF